MGCHQCRRGVHAWWMSSGRILARRLVGGIGSLMWWEFWDDYPETYLTDEDIAILGSSPFIKP